jgi:hypothetical protein
MCGKMQLCNKREKMQESDRNLVGFLLRQKCTPHKKCFPIVKLKHFFMENGSFLRNISEDFGLDRFLWSHGFIWLGNLQKNYVQGHGMSKKLKPECPSCQISHDLAFILQSLCSS